MPATHDKSLRSTTIAANVLNSSRGRGRKIHTSPSKSLENLHIPETSRPLVVHTPVRSSSVPISYCEDPVSTVDNSIASSAQSTPSHLQLFGETNSTDTSETVNAFFDSFASISQTTTLLGFPMVQGVGQIPTIMANAGANVDTTARDEAIMSVLQNIQETQTNLQCEFGALRATVSNLSQRSGTLMDQAPTGDPRFSANLLPSISAEPANNLPANSRGKIDLEKWKIKFDGTGSVEDFLFRLNILVERTRCPVELLEANFQIFLSGKAESWYWDFIKTNNDPPYRLLKRAISKEFASLETDDDILMQLNMRKQNHKESYDDFHSFMVSLNSRMSESLSENRLMNILQKNIKPELRLMLFSSRPTDLHNLRDIAREAEKVIKENKGVIPSKTLHRQVNALELTSDDEEDKDFEYDPQIEVLQISRRPVKPDYSRIKCWNCLSLGHSYIYCTDVIRSLFCYKCGERGITTPTCKNPHPGNRKRSEMATGDSRSQAQPPSSS